MRTSNDGHAHLLAPLVILVIVALLVAVDLFVEFRDGIDMMHIIIEGSIVFASLFGATLLANRYREERRAERQRIEHLEEALDEASKEREKWRVEAAEWQDRNRDLIQGLSDAIDDQFEVWGLTPAEFEVARLLLKGLTFQEIADIRDVSERTVRSQARSVYKKANLSSRAELSAFFLEDLLVSSEGSNAE